MTVAESKAHSKLPVDKSHAIENSLTKIRHLDEKKLKKYLSNFFLSVKLLDISYYFP